MAAGPGGGWRDRSAGWRGLGFGAGAGAGARRCRWGSEGEYAVVVGDAEVGEAREVNGCGSGGEPEVVGGDTSVGNASGFVTGAPHDREHPGPNCSAGS